MSMSGATETQNELMKLIQNGSQKEALQKIENLSRLDLIFRDEEHGLEPIHWAAKAGMLKVCRALVKQGINPFRLDKNGYSLYYHARQAKSIEVTAWFQSELPFFQAGLLNLDAIDIALLNSGLHAFHIPPMVIEEEKDGKKRSKKQLATFFLLQLLQNEVPSDTANAKLVNQNFLTQMIAGLIEEITPTEILALLTAIYPKLDLNHNLKMTAIFIVKELIRLDAEQEWTKTKEFKAELKLFIEKMGKGKPALEVIKSKLKQGDASKFRFEHLESAEHLALDLSKAFTDEIMQITPQQFLRANLAQAQQDLAEFGDRLSYRVCLDVVSANTPQEAANIIGFYLDTMGYCLNERTTINAHMPYNFPAAFSIYQGLGMHAVSRLKEANALLSEGQQQTLSKYAQLFNPTGSHSALRKSIAQHPNSIPVISLYSGDKDKHTENGFADRVEVAGQTNITFFKQREYLATLPVTKFHTNLMRSLPAPGEDKMNEKAERRSFLIEPPRIIELDANFSLDETIKTLNYCITTNAPLVAKENGLRYYDHKAKAQIAAYLRTQFGMSVTFPSEPSSDAIKMRDIIDLCTKVIVNFDNYGKEPADIDDMRMRVAKLHITKKPQRLTRQSIVGLDLAGAFEEKGFELNDPLMPKNSSANAKNIPKEEDYLVNRRKRFMVKTTKVQDLSSSARSFTPLVDAKKSQTQSSPQILTDNTGKNKEIEKNKKSNIS